MTVSGEATLKNLRSGENPSEVLECSSEYKVQTARGSDLPACFFSSFDDLVAYGITYELRYGVQFEFAQYIRAVSIYCLSANAEN